MHDASFAIPQLWNFSVHFKAFSVKPTPKKPTPKWATCPITSYHFGSIMANVNNNLLWSPSLPPLRSHWKWGHLFIFNAMKKMVSHRRLYECDATGIGYRKQPTIWCPPLLWHLHSLMKCSLDFSNYASRILVCMRVQWVIWLRPNDFY